MESRICELIKQKRGTEIKPECGTVQKSLHLVGLQHLCVGTHQLTAPHGSAFHYSACTDSMKVALTAAVECLPSKLPSWAATDVSGSCTNAGTRTNAVGNQSARTHTTLTPPTGNLFSTRSLFDGSSGDEEQGHNKSLLKFSSVPPSAGTKPLSVCAAVPRVLARKRGGEGTRFGGEGLSCHPLPLHKEAICDRLPAVLVHLR
jgi:hypothetical protein